VQLKPGHAPTQKYVRRLRAILHQAKKTGLAAQNKRQHPHFEAHVRGMVSYIHMINPRQAEKLRESIAVTPVACGEGDFTLTVSIGATELMPDDTAEGLWSRLGEAIARAKQAGGDQLVVHDGATIGPAAGATANAAAWRSIS